jgi:hypothetical protein
MMKINMVMKMMIMNMNMNMNKIKIYINNKISITSLILLFTTCLKQLRFNYLIIHALNSDFINNI